MSNAFVFTPVGCPHAYMVTYEEKITAEQALAAGEYLQSGKAEDKELPAVTIKVVAADTPKTQGQQVHASLFLNKWMSNCSLGSLVETPRRWVRKSNLETTLEIILEHADVEGGTLEQKLVGLLQAQNALCDQWACDGFKGTDMGRWLEEKDITLSEIATRLQALKQEK